MQQCILSRSLQAENLMEDACKQRTGLERTKAIAWWQGQRVEEMVEVGDKGVTSASVSLYALNLHQLIT